MSEVWIAVEGTEELSLLEVAPKPHLLRGATVRDFQAHCCTIFAALGYYCTLRGISIYFEHIHSRPRV